MAYHVKCGDVLEHAADVLVCSANPFLNLSGGVGGALLLRSGNGIQEELWSYLRARGIASVPPGSVVQTGAGSLPYSHILHAVAVDAFYSSSADVIGRTIDRALRMALELRASNVVMPALGTGYGRLKMADFAKGLLQVGDETIRRMEKIVVVVRDPDDARTLEWFLCRRHAPPL